MSYNVKDFDEALAIYEKNKVDGKCDADIKLSEDLAMELVGQMTYREKATMLRGHWNPVLDFLKTFRYYNALPIRGGGCKRLGIPPIRFSDGPRGVVVGHSTCYPTANVRAASFDSELEYKIGNAIAEECIAYGANYFAGICINLLRHPAWGRAQESYGEDQFLLGQMGVALTKAVQEHGIVACPKHYAMNSMENLRFKVDVQADEDTIRDVYLPHFKDCIDAGALSIMGAYNKYRGKYCCENEYLLKTILRDEWNFKGFATSDFIWGVHEGVESLKCGMDIEMPLTYRRMFIEGSLKKDKEADEAAIESCKLITASLLRIQGLYRKQEYSKDVILSKPHTDLARKALEEGAVLLKNNNNILPITDKNEKIAVVGRYADKKNIGDHGSSTVFPTYVVTLGGAMSEEYKDVTVCSTSNINKCVKASEGADKVIVVAGFSNHEEGEFLVNLPGSSIGGDRPSLRLPIKDVNLIKAMKQAGKKVIVVFYAGSATIIDEWVDDAEAIIDAGYPGLEGGHALVNLISGKVNFSGKLPFTVAHKEEDYPEFIWRGDNPKIDYGYYHGYCKFEKEEIEPAFPFGFGLSYTTYEFNNLLATKVDEGVEVKVDVTNTGDVQGREVVQVYVGFNIEGKPNKLLKGFTSVELSKGETKTATVFIPTDKLKLFDKNTMQYIYPTNLTIYAGDSSVNNQKVEL